MILNLEGKLYNLGELLWVISQVKPLFFEMSPWSGLIKGSWFKKNVFLERSYLNILDTYNFVP